MKNLFQLFRKNSTTVHIIAGAMIICMGLVDASLYTGYALGQKDAVDDLRVVTEEHEMEFAGADGIYNGQDSDSSEYEYHPVDVEDGKNIFNILEILPTERAGVIGYTIGGCEPFANAKGIRNSLTGEYIVSPQQMRTAYMDALVNPNPGEDKVGSACFKPGINEQVDSNSQNVIDKLKYSEIKEMNSAFSDGGMQAFSFETKETDWSRNTGVYNGYYKYIGGNKGVYSLVSRNGNDVVMHSRFYYESDHNDYIFVYSDEDVSNPDITVKNQKRIKYVNNEKFLKECYGLTDNPNTSVDEIKEWKDNHVIEVVTRSPQNTSYEDIERADVIVINNAGNNTMRYYRYACNLYNRLKGDNVNTDVDKHFYNPSVDDPNEYYADGTRKKLDKDKRIDFDEFQKAIRIYERVVIRKDVALIASKTAYNNVQGPNGGKKFDTNLGKLMCMLFFVVTRDDSTPGIGREFFMDFMKRYTSNPGDYDAGLNSSEPGKTYWDLRTENENYIAPSLRGNTWNYMHHHIDVDFHPGHPITVNRGDAITGGEYVNGVLEPRHDGTVYRRTIRRGPSHDRSSEGETYFRNAGDPGYYYRDTVQEAGMGDDYLGGNAVSLAYNHPWCLDGYESMSNTTDFMYIDDNGILHRDAKYSGDNGYWFKADYEDGADWFAYKKIKWNAAEWDEWYITTDLKSWLMSKGSYERDGSDTGNMHLYWDYYSDAFSPYHYRGLNDVGGSVYADKDGVTNQSIGQESDLFKNNNGKNLFKTALNTRLVEREITGEKHKETVQKDYYISMNILNGDGVNKSSIATQKNKTLYFNAYEKDDIKDYENPAKNTSNPSGNAKIPLRIRMVTSCPIVQIYIYDKNGGIAQYNYDPDNTGKVGNSVLTIPECTGSKGKKLELKRVVGTYGENGVPKLNDGSDDVTPLGSPKYTYEGYIFDVKSNYYLEQRNEKVTVRLTVKAPDKKEKTVEDSITIVKRDFFMLN